MALIAITFFIAHPAPWAQASAIDDAPLASEERVKAAFVLKFLQYVEWPSGTFAQTDSPYVIGIIGADNVADALTKLSEGRTVNNRTVVIRKLQETDPGNDVHVMYIGRTGPSSRSPAIRQTRTFPTLVVTEADGALEMGSMINFRVVDDRIRFEVALEHAERARLKISSRMLAVAIAVTKGEKQ